MSCPYCQETQYPTKKSMQKFLSFSLIIFLPLFIPAFFDVPLAVSLSLTLILGTVVILFYPFFVELSDEKEDII